MNRKSWKYEDWLLKNRSAMAGAITVLVILELALFVRVLLWGSWLGVDSIEVIEGLLATGTFALAFAALVQATSAERKRRADLLPHLDIRVLWPESSGQVLRSEPIAYNIFPVEIPPDGSLTGVIRNLGPGHAMRVNAVAYSWWVHGSPSPSEGFGTPVEESSLGFEPLVNDFALKANEEYKFPIMVLLPTSATVQDSTGHPILRRQLLVAATCEDVEGTPAGFVRMGMYLIGPVLPYPHRLLSWKTMDDETALRIHRKQENGIH